MLQSRFDEPEALLDLLKKGPEPLQSHFATGYGMVLKVLHQRTMASARAFVERSFYNYLGDPSQRFHFLTFSICSIKLLQVCCLQRLLVIPCLMHHVVS